MTKFRTILTAVFTAIVLALTSLVPVFKGVAFASDAPAEPEPPTIIYEELYYFSDNQKCANRYNDYILDYIAEYNYCYDANMTGHLIDWSCYGNPDDSYNCVMQYFMDYYDFSNITNSLVIFELTNDKTLKCLLGYPDDPNGMGGENILNALFEMLKNKGCKIMFITDVEEAVFITRRSFLKYVDIHINTDLFINFLSNLFFRIINDGRIDNCTFIFDMSLSAGAESSFGYDMPTLWFFESFIVPYLKAIYFEELADVNYEFYPVLKNNRIEFLFYLGNGNFFDAVECYTFSADYNESTFDWYMSNENVFAVGTSWYGKDVLKEFINIIQNAAYNYGYNPQFFIYNENGYELEIDSYFVLREGGGNLRNFENLLPPIIYDFIMGGDLSVYDNWTGLCEVTYKPVTYGEDGWLIDFGWDEENCPYFWGWLEGLDDPFNWIWKG